MQKFPNVIEFYTIDIEVYQKKFPLTPQMMLKLGQVGSSILPFSTKRLSLYMSHQGNWSRGMTALSHTSILCFAVDERDDISFVKSMQGTISYNNNISCDCFR
jgi:hypothetical protein